MPRPSHDRPRLSRRELLRLGTLAPFALRPAPLSGLFAGPLLANSVPHPAAAFADPRYTPTYPVRSPLDDLLRLVPPGFDEYRTELYAHEIGLVLNGWQRCLQTGRLAGLRPSLAEPLPFASPTPSRVIPLRSGNGVDSVRREFPQPAPGSVDQLLRATEADLGPGARVEVAEFEITSLSIRAPEPLTVATTHPLLPRPADHSLPCESSASAPGRLSGAANPARTPPGWSPAGRATPETRATVRGPGFHDAAPQAFRDVPSFSAQLLHGADHWRTVLDGASGIDVYGNNGVAVGDFDGDGRDDLYVCQPAGLPNRLYRNRGDGTFEDSH